MLQVKGFQKQNIQRSWRGINQYKISKDFLKYPLVTLCFPDPSRDWLETPQTVSRL